MNLNTGVISDNQGESIGSASNYIARFKRIDAGEDVPNVPEFTSVKEKITALPGIWEGNDKEILTHYYRRFGDHSCSDFQSVSAKIAQNVNRLFKKTFSAEDILKMLTDKISIEDVANYDAKVQIPGNVKGTSVQSKIKINLKEASYDFILGRPALTPEYLDLIPFVEASNLCFSTDGYNIFVATRPECELCFENLFNFTAREEMVFQMFKEQLGDEMKSKKMVLMSKLLNQQDVPEPPLTVNLKQGLALKGNNLISLKKNSKASVIKPAENKDRPAELF